LFWVERVYGRLVLIFVYWAGVLLLVLFSLEMAERKLIGTMGEKRGFWWILCSFSVC